jgi:hypothetical protein
MSYEIFYLCIFYVSFFWFIKKNTNFATLLPIGLSYSVGFIIILLFKFYPSIDPHFNSDGAFYYNEGKRLLEEFFFRGNIGWVYVNSLFIWIFDEALYVLRLFNLTLYILLVLLSIKYIQRDMNTTVNHYYVFLLCFIPSLYFFSVLNLKETSILMCTYAIILIATSNYKIYSKVFMIAPLLGFLTLERIYIGIIFIVMGFIYFILLEFNKSTKRKLLSVLFITISFIVVLSLNDYLPFEFLRSGFEEIQRNSNSGLEKYITSPTSVLDILLSLPYRVLLYILIPLPWEMTGMLYLIGILENYLLFIPLFVYVLLNYKIVKENKYLLLSLAFVFANILFYSSVMSNMGIVVRFKSHALFVLIVMFIYIRIYKKSLNEKNIDNK